MKTFIKRGGTMTKYEELMAEYEHLHIEERPMKNDGLYADDCVWINKNMTSSRKYCTLAEEIGHYETSCGDILDQSDASNRKQERLARQWAYEKLIPIENIHFAASDGYTQLWEMAEYLDVDEAFLKEALIYYRILDI